MAGSRRDEEDGPPGNGQVPDGVASMRVRVEGKLLAAQVFLYHLATFSSGRPKTVDVLVLFSLLQAVNFALAAAVMVGEFIALPQAAVEHRYALALGSSAIAAWWSAVCAGVVRRSKLAWLATPFGAGSMLLLRFGGVAAVASGVALVASVMPGTRAWFAERTTSLDRRSDD